MSLGGGSFPCKTPITFLPSKINFAWKFSIFQKVFAWVRVDRVGGGREISVSITVRVSQSHISLSQKVTPPLFFFDVIQSNAKKNVLKITLLSSYIMIKLSSFKCPANDMASEDTPSCKQPSPQKHTILHKTFFDSEKNIMQSNYLFIPKIKSPKQLF